MSPSELPARLGRAAALALKEEASLPGKPGLVGPASRGSHLDMNLELMIGSAQALEPWFEACASLALSFPGEDPRELFKALRVPGREAEKAMFAATGGVNTHKGALFTLGLLVAASIWEVRHPVAFPAQAPLGERILSQVALMGRGLSAELGQGPDSAGSRLYRELGVRGIRGEAEAGYPVLAARVLPPLRRARGRGPGAREDALLEALLGAMGDLEDSCVLARGGREGLAFVRSRAREVLAAWMDGKGREGLELLNVELVARRLSPGGSADLVAAGIFLDGLEGGPDWPT